MLALIAVISVIVILAVVVWDIKRSREQAPAIDQLIGELQAKQIASLMAYRGQERNSEEDELRAAIEWAAKDLGLDK